jgi:hypothetical protein
VQSKSRRRRANAVCSIEVIMKVDKGVCTSNDAYFAGNTTSNELNSIIKFETVFTTLVENKILAIKRECEEHESKKKARTLKGILLRKANDAAIDGDKMGEVAVATADGENDRKKRKNFFSKYYKKQKHNIQEEEVDVERGDADGDELMNVVVVPSENNNADHQQGLQRDAKVDSQISNELELVNADANLPNSSTKLNAAAAAECDKRNCDKLIIDSRETNNAQVTLSTTNNHSNVIPHSRKQQQAQQQTINYENDESLATTIDISLQQSSAVVVVAASAKADTTAIVPINNNVNVNNQNNNRSDVAICDDGASSQNTSDIEFSLNSENNSVSELPRSSAKCKSVVNSDPVIKKFVNVVSPPPTREKKVCERKAISCQSTPIFGRHKHVRSESEGKKVLTFQKESQSKNVSKASEAIKSHQTIVIAPTSTTTTTTLAKTVTTTAAIPLETVHASKKKHSTKIRDVSVEYEITYDNEERNQSPHGFISSFNQLTSQKQSAAIISANIKKQASKDHQRKSQDVDRVDATTKSGRDIELELDELDVEVVNKKKKKRRSELNFFGGL